MAGVTSHLEREITRLISEVTSPAKQKDLANIDRLMTKFPLTTTMYRRGLITLDQMRNRPFVLAMEKSLNLRQEREGSLAPAGSTRQPSGFSPTQSLPDTTAVP